MSERRVNISLTLGIKIHAKGKSLSFEYTKLYIIKYGAAMGALTGQLR